MRGGGGVHSTVGQGESWAEPGVVERAQAQVERAPELHHVGEAVVGALFEAAAHGPLHDGGQAVVGGEVCEAGHGRGQVGHQQAGAALVGEGRAADEQAEEQAAEGVDVGAAVHGVAHGLLGGHVHRGADHRVHAGEVRGVVEVLGDAEVDEMDVWDGVANEGTGHEQVARLEVAVDDALGVGGFEGPGDLLRERENGVWAGSLVFEEGAEGRAFQVLHHQVRNVVVDEAMVEDLHHVRVAQARECVGLAEEAGAVLVPGLGPLVAGDEDLDGDEPTRPFVHPAVHLRHGRDGELLQDAEAPADHQPEEGVGLVRTLQVGAEVRHPGSGSAGASDGRGSAVDGGRSLRV